MKLVQLSDQVTTGREQWLSWHANFAENRARRLQEVSQAFLTSLAFCLAPQVQYYVDSGNHPDN